MTIRREKEMVLHTLTATYRSGSEIISLLLTPLEIGKALDIGSVNSLTKTKKEMMILILRY
jgi:hypothetical protein